MQVKVTDLIKKRSWEIQLIGGNAPTHTHTLHAHPGAVYAVSVRASEPPGARETVPPSRIAAMAIPAPIELSFNDNDNSLYWRKNKNLPLDILKEK